MKTLSRLGSDEQVTVEAHAGLDGQGSPSYAAGQSINASTVKANERAIGSDGSDVRVDLVVWVDAAESPMPDVKDKLTVSSEPYIVVARQDVEDLGGTLDHVRLMCREDGDG